MLDVVFVVVSIIVVVFSLLFLLSLLQALIIYSVIFSIIFKILFLRYKLFIFCRLIIVEQIVLMLLNAYGNLYCVCINL